MFRKVGFVKDITHCGNENPKCVNTCAKIVPRTLPRPLTPSRSFCLLINRGWGRLCRLVHGDVLLDGAHFQVTIYTVTEPVMPLSDKIKELSLEGSWLMSLQIPKQNPKKYSCPLIPPTSNATIQHCTLNGDHYHNANVRFASVAITQTLDWKLYAFDALSEFDGSNETSSGQMLHEVGQNEGVIQHCLHSQGQHT
ncbi:hypothetical protein E2542_SST22379 [Spatholobus suberectus]|nr:hypothetical protein E2542_SST22379 [Spatholobus suberectus]